MKKRQLLALGLLCGIVLPFSTQAYEDGIYTGLVDENGIGVITVIFGGNDTFSGVQLTIKMTDQTGTGGGYYYYRGFNTPTTNSKRSGYNSNSPGEGVTTTETGYQYGNTYGAIRNNQWGGGGDTYANKFNPNPDNLEARQGPCDSGYHVPSRGERNALAIAWCNLDEECNATYYDATTNSSGDLRKANNWTSGNQLIYISKSWLGTKFKDMFNMSGNDYNNYWSSSPDPYDVYYSWSLYLDANYVGPGGSDGYRNNYSRVRCLRNSIIKPAPQTFTLSFTGSEGGNVSTGSIEVEEGSSISRDDEAGTVSISGAVVVTGIADEGYIFSGWLTDCVSGTVTTGCSFTGVFNLETYMITYKLNGGTNSENNLTGYTIKDSITFANPTKEGYNFEGWFSDEEFTTGVKTIPTGTTGNITLYAKWTEIKKSSGGSSGGGGRSSSKDVISNDSEKSSEQPAGSQVDSSEQAPQNDNSNTQDSSVNTSEGHTYTQEFQEAYEFAKEKGITTMPTIHKADMNGKLTRIAMAKMLSQYAMNVLGQKPANIVTPKFNDVTDKQNSDYDDGVTLAYQLGIMGQNMPGNKFRPDDEVTRAEFATALSRMLYHTSDGEYKSTDKYYTNHMSKLVREGIITKDDPKMKELRGYVMIMLMRSAK